MSIDPNNPVVKLCAEGVGLELSGKRDEAERLYEEAWKMRVNDYESCIVAHYLARVQRTAELLLHWNLEALRYAELVGDDRVALFFPSLYLNIGKAYEDLGNREEAQRNYQLGLEKSGLLPDDKLGSMTRDGLTRGLRRLSYLE